MASHHRRAREPHNHRGHPTPTPVRQSDQFNEGATHMDVGVLLLFQNWHDNLSDAEMFRQ
jgi:hypothetical protein